MNSYAYVQKITKSFIILRGIFRTFMSEANFLERRRSVEKDTFDVNTLDKIIKKTVEAVNNSKSQMLDIAEGAKRECRRLEQDLKQLKQQLIQMFDNIEYLEKELKASRKRLVMLSKKFQDRTDAQFKEVYEKTDELRIQLAVKKEQEQNYILRRNELEIRLREAHKTVEKAQQLMSQLSVAIGYLTGDLQQLSFQLEDMKKRQNLGVKIIQAQEEERQRVARDIHDGPAQSMSNVVLKADICEKLLDVDIGRTKSELKQLKTFVRSCLQDVRRIIYDLRPMSLDDLGLVPTIRRYISNYIDETGMIVTFRTQDIQEDIKSVIALTIFRIVQEALSNVKKHAMARNVVIKLIQSEKEIEINVYDDGKGFNVEEINKNAHDTSFGFGVCSMKERVELLNGKFELKSQEGKGTRIYITIPLALEEGERDE